MNEQEPPVTAYEPMTAARLGAYLAQSDDRLRLRGMRSRRLLHDVEFILGT
jgi:hypothetical protein